MFSSGATAASSDRRAVHVRPANRRGIDASPPPHPRGDRRVREEVRDGLAVVAASAGASTAVAVLATVVVKIAG